MNISFDPNNLTPITLYGRGAINYVTKEYCHDWCIQQHFMNNYHGIIFVFIACGLIIFYKIIKDHKDKEKIANICLSMAIYCLFAFFAYVIYVIKFAPGG